jgi:hypothetical protein
MFAKAEVARGRAYRLYTLCERRKRAAEALVRDHPARREGGAAASAQLEML